MRTGISVDEALEAVLREVTPLPAETIDTAAALGRVLADPVVARFTLPPAACSAMDGYAVRGSDLAGATTDRPAFLQQVYEIPAGGSAPRALEVGETARIFTGAPLPPGADAVVRQEDTVADGATIRFDVAPGPREHVREAGEDVERGDRVLEPGRVLGAAHLGMLAALGRSLVRVVQRPRVAILSGGDELVEPDETPSGGKIISSNAYTLAAACRAVGADPTNLGIAPDDPRAIEGHLRAGLGADVLVSTAGVSVGDHDHVRPVLEALGCELVFWGVLMKPGFPIAFGRFPSGGPLVFGLPGNPVSALVTFLQFVRPALLRLEGRERLTLPRVRARLSHPLDKKPGRRHFVRVTFERKGGELFVTSTGNQSSGVLRSMALAHGLLDFPAEASALAAGDWVSVQVIDPDAIPEEDDAA